jgi:hypothetical protein
MKIGAALFLKYCCNSLKPVPIVVQQASATHVFFIFLETFLAVPSRDQRQFMKAGGKQEIKVPPEGRN